MMYPRYLYLNIFLSLFYIKIGAHLSFVDKDVYEYATSLNSQDFEESFDIQEQEVDLSRILRWDLLEGDIKGLTHESVDNFVRSGDSSISYDMQNSAVRNRYNVWPSQTIPYQISSQLTSNARKMIAKAIKNFHQNTCLRFVPRTNQDDYIYIMADNGCYSHIGRIGGQQVVSLDDGCFQRGVILHELMHAAGFFHEQNRNDRDSYVTIFENNIMSGYESNFKKRSLETIDHLGTSYDYGSVMHYGANYFSKNRNPTIKPKRNGVTIGQRNGFSRMDIIRLNKLYKCSEKPTTSTARPITRPSTTTTIKPTTTQSSNTCPKKRDFRCKKSNTCIRESKYCDGKRDCPDGSDEPAKCVLCNTFQFICKRQADCIHRNQVCDGRRDCNDGTDEKDCE